MKIQCSVCDAAEAKVLCCADEAALCWDCDKQVHAANKLAGKHQRVPLSTSNSQMPKCDICQETVGFFFCLEDRALLCRKCDVAIHTVNPLVSAHQRFLLTGVKVGPESADNGATSASTKTPSTHSNERNSDQVPPTLSKRTAQASSTAECSKHSPAKSGTGGDLSSSKLPFAGGGATGGFSPWPLDEFLGFGDFNQYYNFMDNPSKADSGKLGDPDCSPILGAADVELDGDECLGQVPDTFWSVPEIISPPTATGLYWPKNYQKSPESAVFVPDVSSLPMEDYQHNPSKRRRHF